MGQVAAGQPAKPGGKGAPAVPATPAVPEAWTKLRVGSIVLASDDKEDGWWEAVVVAVRRRVVAPSLARLPGLRPVQSAADTGGFVVTYRTALNLKAASHTGRFLPKPDVSTCWLHLDHAW